MKPLLTLGNIIQKWIPSALSSSIAKENNSDHMFQNTCSHVRLESLAVFIVPMTGSWTKEGGLYCLIQRGIEVVPWPLYHFCDLVVTVHSPRYRHSVWYTNNSLYVPAPLLFWTLPRLQVEGGVLLGSQLEVKAMTRMTRKATFFSVEMEIQ